MHGQNCFSDGQFCSSNAIRYDGLLSWVNVEQNLNSSDDSCVGQLNSFRVLQCSIDNDFRTACGGDWMDESEGQLLIDNVSIEDGIIIRRVSLHRVRVSAVKEVGRVN